MFHIDGLDVLIVLTVITTVVLSIVMSKTTDAFAYKTCESDDKLEHLKGKLKILLVQPNKKWGGNLHPLNSRNVYEECSICKHKETFTINKQDISLCMHDEKGEYYEDNMLIYVLLHELAHVVCKEVGHTKLFNDIFNELIVEADAVGIYDKNFNPNAVQYCNVTDSYTV